MVAQGVRNRTFTILMIMRTAMCSHCMLMVARPLSFEIRVWYSSVIQLISARKTPAGSRDTHGTHTGAHKQCAQGLTDHGITPTNLTQPTPNPVHPPTHNLHVSVTTETGNRDRLNSRTPGEPTAPPRGFAADSV